MAKIYKMLVCSLILCFLASCSGMINDFGNLETAADYTVETWIESTETDDFILDESLTTTCKATAVSGIDSPSYTGLIFDHKDINESNTDGKVRFYFKRKIVSITYDPNGGVWKTDLDSNAKKIDGKFESKVPEYPSKADLFRLDFTYCGWDTNYETFPSEDVTVSAVWSDTYYTVSYQKQNIYDDKYTAFNEIKVLGEKNTMTSVTADVIPGFKDPVISQQLINEDNSTVVTVKYDRNEYKYTFKLSDDASVAAKCVWKDGTKENKEITARYEAALNVSAFVEPTYGDVDSEWGFTGWNVEGGILPATFTEDKTFVAQWAHLPAKYTVRTYKENPDSGEFEVDGTEEKNGTVGRWTNVSANPITGYTIKEIEQKIILEDDSTIIDVYYELAKITVKFNVNGGTWDNGSTEDLVYEGKYGQPLIVEYPNGKQPSKEYCIFKGWAPEFYRGPNGDRLRFPIENNTYTAQWENIAESVYKVRYFVENNKDVAGNEDFVLTGEPQTYKGLIGEKTNVHPEMTGFHSDNIEQKEIVKEGTTVVDVYWKRNVYTISFDPNDGTWVSNSSQALLTLKGKYEANVPFTDSVSMPDYKFDGWDPELPSNFIFTEDKTYKAKWEKVGTPYTVKYMFEKVSHDGTNKYEERTDLLDSVEKTGSYYTSTVFTSSEAPSVAGFVFSNAKYDNYAVLNADGSIQIKADGTTVITAYYNRRADIIYKFDAKGGSWADGATTKAITGGIYGHSVDMTSIGNPSWLFHVFNGWSPAVDETFAAEDKTFIAQWTEIPTTVIKGVGIYTAKDSLNVTAAADGKNVTVTVRVPYDDTWTFDWYDNGVSITSDIILESVSDGVQKFSREFASGHHKITVYAKDSGGGIEEARAVESAYVTFRVE